MRCDPLAGFETVPKVWRGGTHRSATPDRTRALIDRFRAAMGITRLADVTGLDRIGVPVQQAVRPNSRSIAVSQGKGLTPEAAGISALMESIESYHAERPEIPLLLGSHDELRHRHRIVDVHGLPRPAMSRFRPDARILWASASDLTDGEATLVPYECVHTDYRMPLPAGSGCFAMTSNGIAAGNHLLEAISHGLCELIERDGISIWAARQDQEDVKVDERSVDDPACRSLLEAFDETGFDVSIWDGTTIVGVPVMIVATADRHDDDLSPSFGAYGYGCHPSREIALARALTEAAQARLTYIAGSRDDSTPAQYAYGLSSVVRDSIAELARSTASNRRFADVATTSFDNINDDVGHLLERLASAGFGEVVYLDLSLEHIGIPVVRVIAPGLELGGITDTVRFGARSSAAALGRVS